MKGAIENTVEYSKLAKDHNIANIPIVKKQSPTLFVKKADKELWFAAILVNQKLTNKYEQTPTPSQPTNISKKLSPVTKIIIIKVNKLK
jgi:hypothetical protein